MSIAGKKFFTEDFDMIARQVAPVPRIAVESFLAEDLAAARQLAWDAGFQAGRAAENAASAADIQNSLAKITAALHTLQAEASAQATQMAEALAGLLLAALGHVLPELCARHGAAEINAVAQEILPALLADPHLRVHVAPEREAALRGYLAGLEQEALSPIRLLPSAALGPADIVIRWHQGEAGRNAAALWEDILTILVPLGLQHAALETPVQHRNMVNVE